MVRHSAHLATVPFVIGLFIAGCTTLPQTTSPPAQARVTHDPFKDGPLETALEPEKPAEDQIAYLRQSEKDPSGYELISKYRGKIYVATAYMYKVDIAPGLRWDSPSIVSAPDRVYFLLAPGQSAPNHPAHHLVMNWFDSQHPVYNFKPGRKFYIAYTESGLWMAMWPASLKVVPGMYYPRDDDPNDDRPPQPPVFQLVYVKSD
jgi:hypothetical protein